MSARRPAGEGGDWRRPVGAAEREALRTRLPGAGGLCASCRHLRLVRSRRSSFVRCALADSDPAFPRYPALPVLACPGYTASSEESPSRRGPGPA